MQTLSGNAENWSPVILLLPMIPDKSEKLHTHCRKRSKHKSEIRKIVMTPIYSPEIYGLDHIYLAINLDLKK